MATKIVRISNIPKLIRPFGNPRLKKLSDGILKSISIKEIEIEFNHKLGM